MYNEKIPRIEQLYKLLREYYHVNYCQYNDGMFYTDDPEDWGLSARDAFGYDDGFCKFLIEKGKINPRESWPCRLKLHNTFFGDVNYGAIVPPFEDVNYKEPPMSLELIMLLSVSIEPVRLLCEYFLMPQDEFYYINV